MRSLSSILVLAVAAIAPASALPFVETVEDTACLTPNATAKKYEDELGMHVAADQYLWYTTQPPSVSWFSATSWGEDSQGRYATGTEVRASCGELIDCVLQWVSDHGGATPASHCDVA